MTPSTEPLEDNQRRFLSRFYIYQKERFPFLAHGVLIASFTFSALSYSRICRGVQGFVEGKAYAVAVLTTISFFLLLRIFDEFKDAEDDAKFRKELPVPRGLISLRELFRLGVFLVIFQIALNLIFYPVMLGLYFLMFLYLCLMGKEFFVAEWLKKHQFWYVVSHMLIIPLVDVFASGFDWMLEGAPAPTGLLFFFAVSFMNGVVLEIGRKIRVPEKESEGVLTYTSMLGIKTAPALWILVLTITVGFAMAACWFAGYGSLFYIILAGFFVLCAVPALLFISKPNLKLSKTIELASALWTVAMYLTLGGAPMLVKLIGS